MKLGFIGLGKMGSQMVARLISSGHEVVVFDLNATAVETSVRLGAIAASDRADMAAQLGEQLVVWLMIPAGAVDAELELWSAILPDASVIVDGGNSDYRDTLKRAKRLETHGIILMDVGTSGGVLGLKDGFSMMIGGTPVGYALIERIIASLSRPGGYRHFGPVGAGHYIKMVHNAIEYGVMEAYAEGYELLAEAKDYPELDLAAVAEVWQHGSIIESNLNAIAGQALAANPQLDGIEGFVAESGEARWALETAKIANVGTPAIQAAFDVRIASQVGRTSFATKLLAAMRNVFGGHSLNK